MQHHSLNRVRPSGLRCKAYPDVDHVGDVPWRSPKWGRVLRQTLTYPVHRPHRAPGSTLLASGQPAPSPEPSTGLACSLEINRDPQVTHSKHSFGYQASGGEFCLISLSTSPLGFTETKTWGGWEKALAHTFAQSPVSVHLSKMSPMLFPPSLAVKTQSGCEERFLQCSYWRKPWSGSKLACDQDTVT